MIEDDPTAYPTLDDTQLAVLDGLGTRRSVAAGEYLFREGDPTYDFYVIVSGAVDIVLHSDGEERVITRHGAGRFLGELSLLTGLRVLLSARVAEPGEVIVVPAADLRRVLATQPGLGDTILAAFIARRAVLRIEDQTKFAVRLNLPPTTPSGEVTLKLSASVAPDLKQPNVRVKGRDVELVLNVIPPPK